MHWRANMATHPAMSEAVHRPVTIAILAKAPVPGFAKTRLIPALGAHGAAAFQERLIEDTVARAREAVLGPIHLWAAPDATHPAFHPFTGDPSIALMPQPDGDLGRRMLAAAKNARPVLIIGTDCPALSSALLRDAANVLLSGTDVVVVPAHDGGYVLIGMRTPQPALFENMRWSTPYVLEETRARIRALGIKATEFAPLWDVDEPDDLARLGPEWYAAGFAP